MAKRIFDLSLSLFILFILLVPLLFIFTLLLFSDIKESPLFYQKRVGKNNTVFTIIKFRTMKNSTSTSNNTITVVGDSRITRIGSFLRKFKLDELPSLINVVIGDMSLVGPRPDVPGYADMLKGEDRKILLLRPGITGSASLKYANEEYLLEKVSDPKSYNDTIIWPDKVKINLDYYYNNNLIGDIKIIFQTIFRNYDK